MKAINEKKRINLIMGEFLIDQMDYMASQRGLSRSAFVSMLVFNEFQKLTNENESKKK